MTCSELTSISRDGPCHSPIKNSTVFRSVEHARLSGRITLFAVKLFFYPSAIRDCSFVLQKRDDIQSVRTLSPTYQCNQLRFDFFIIWKLDYPLEGNCTTDHDRTSSILSCRKISPLEYPYHVSNVGSHLKHPDYVFLIREQTVFHLSRSHVWRFSKKVSWTVL